MKIKRTLPLLVGISAGILFAAGGTWTAWQGVRTAEAAFGKQAQAVSAEYRRTLKRDRWSGKLDTPSIQVMYRFVDERGVTNSAWSGSWREDPMKAGATVRYGAFPAWVTMLESEYRRNLLLLGIVGSTSLLLLAVFLRIIFLLSESGKN